MQKTNARIYTVTNTGTNVRHLVKATSAAQAVRHAANEHFSVAVASQDDIVEIVGTGCKVHDATAKTEVQSEQQEGDE